MRSVSFPLNCLLAFDKAVWGYLQANTEDSMFWEIVIGSAFLCIFILISIGRLAFHFLSCPNESEKCESRSYVSPLNEKLVLDPSNNVVSNEENGEISPPTPNIMDGLLSIRSKCEGLLIDEAIRQNQNAVFKNLDPSMRLFWTGGFYNLTESDNWKWSDEEEREQYKYEHFCKNHPPCKKKK